MEMRDGRGCGRGRETGVRGGGGARVGRKEDKKQQE